MAQTKRKRRTKHRGNAAGSIETRGRTGRKPTADEQKKVARQSARDRRLSKPPTWKSALAKAAAMSALLFVLTQTGLVGKNATLAQGVMLAAFALVLYTPLAFMTDKWVYNRAKRAREQRKG